MDAYADFIDAASTGRFRAPASGDWTAEQIVAQVARNHEQLVAVTESVLAGDEVTYDNRVPSPRELDRYVAAYGGLAGLVDRVAQTVTVLRDLAYRLNDKGSTWVRTVRADPPIPWAKVLELDETVHVPRYLQELDALRITER
jgi:hypothetical protein